MSDDAAKEWERRIAPGSCPFDDGRDLSENLYLVQELDVSTLYLDTNQTYRGHCVLTYKPHHVTRIDQLSTSEWEAMSRDIRHAEMALINTFDPDHINIASLGQIVPHLHWHIIPRYLDDPRWGGPIWTTNPEEMPVLRLAQHDYEARAALIRTNLISKGEKSWPGDVDGDVFRRLQAKGFDFSSSRKIEFNIDFKTWPPPEAALTLIRQTYPEALLVEPDAEDLAFGDSGFVQIKVVDVLSYELVNNLQSHLTEMLSEFGGICESWGVLVE